ncbi:hypothetical protein [Massilia brevitalea]|uniref:hypothetical protein n=1 Tax=Massilia brevitalea TaxID=442526 RepID=UPI00273A4B9E|nr:hypothetical protein [Massilia brevitalea]
MSMLTLPRRASRQPVREVVIDRTNHLTDGLFGGYLASTGRYFGAAAAAGARFGGTPRMVFDPKFGFGVRRNDTLGGSINQVVTGRAAMTTSDVTILAVARPSSSTSAGAYLATMAQNAGAVGLSIRSGTGTEARYQMTIYINATRVIGGSIPVSPTREVAVVVGRHIRNVEQALFVNGVKDPAVGNFTGSTINLSHFGVLSTGPEQETYMLLVWDRALSDEEIARISADPYQVFAEPGRPMFLKTGAPVVPELLLAGGAQVSVTAAGALSTAVRLGGAAVIRTSTSGALATSLSLAGVGAARSSASGALSTGIELGGVASTRTVAAGVLSTEIPLTGAVAARATAAGVLSTDAATLSGFVIAGSAATGSLSTAISLAGTAAMRALASGQLAGDGAALAGAVTARASAAGELSTVIALSGAASCFVEVSGYMAGAGVALSGAALVRASVAGWLSTSISLAGAGAARSSGTAALTTAIALGGLARASASGAGDLTVGIQYARAPAGAGYTPRRNEYQARPAQGGHQSRPAQASAGGRPPATQENYR